MHLNIRMAHEHRKSKYDLAWFCYELLGVHAVLESDNLDISKRTICRTTTLASYLDTQVQCILYIEKLIHLLVEHTSNLLWFTQSFKTRYFHSIQFKNIAKLIHLLIEHTTVWKFNGQKLTCPRVNNC